MCNFFKVIQSSVLTSILHQITQGFLLTSKLEPYSKHVTKYKTKGENKYKVQIDEFIRLNTSHTKPIYTITYCAYHNHTHSNTVHTQYHILISYPGPNLPAQRNVNSQLGQRLLLYLCSVCVVSVCI